MSDMREINADILQRFLILLILFLFFNASLIKKCEALKIKKNYFYFLFLQVLRAYVVYDYETRCYLPK